MDQKRTGVNSEGHDRFYNFPYLINSGSIREGKVLEEIGEAPITDLNRNLVGIEDYGGIRDYQ